MTARDFGDVLAAAVLVLWPLYGGAFLKIVYFLMTEAAR